MMLKELQHIDKIEKRKIIHISIPAGRLIRLSTNQKPEQQVIREKIISYNLSLKTSKQT